MPSEDRNSPGMFRRDVLAGAAAIAGAAVLANPAALAAGETSAPLLIANDAELEQALPALSNWGRWGAADQLGTLNFMSPATKLAAAALIRSGRVVSLAREFSSA